MRYLSSIIDYIFKIDTEDDVSLQSLGFDKGTGNLYQGTPWHYLPSIINYLKVSNTDVFIDYGSGKGRVLLFAGRYEFKRIIGVELSKELIDISKNNLRSCKKMLRCKNFDLVNKNVIDYEVPKDSTIIFLFNPFPIEIINCVIENIKKSVSQFPRFVRLVYHNPVYAEHIERLHGLIRINKITFTNLNLYKQHCIFYEISIK